MKKVLYLWLKSLFAGYNLAAERVDMAHGVEVRLPYLDHRLSEYASRIPSTLLFRDGRVKYPLREAVRPYLTEEVYAGAKKPFLAPPSTNRAETGFTRCARTRSGVPACAICPSSIQTGVRSAR